MFESDLAHIQRYRAYPCPGLVAIHQPSSVRLLNADPTTALTVCMGTVLGNANPVLPISEHFVREFVPVDPPLTSGPFGPEGEPVERDVADTYGTNADDIRFFSDVFTSTAGYEYPCRPCFAAAESSPSTPLLYRCDITQTEVPLLMVTDSDGYTVHVGGLAAPAGQLDDPSTSSVPTKDVPQHDVGTMPRFAYWDTPAVNPAYFAEDDMPDLYRCVLSDVDPYVAECIYLTESEIREALQWDKLEVVDDMKQRLFSSGPQQSTQALL